MRTLLLAVLVACVLLPARAEATITEVDRVSFVVVNSATSSAIDSSAAKLLICSIAYDNGGTPVVADSQSAGGWVGLTPQGDGATAKEKIFYKDPGASVGYPTTFSISGGSLFAVATCVAFTNDTALSFDVENGANQGSTSSLQTGSVTPSVNNSLVITGVATTSNVAPSSVSTPTMTVINETDVSGGSNWAGATAYYVQTTATAVNPTWAVSGTGNMGAAIAVFKPAGGGGGGGGGTPSTGGMLLGILGQ